MKNKIWNQIKRLGISAILFTAAVCGKYGQPNEIWASDVENGKLTLTQQAQWTDRDNGRGQIIMEISGLSGWKETLLSISYPADESSSRLQTYNLGTEKLLIFGAETEEQEPEEYIASEAELMEFIPSESAASEEDFQDAEPQEAASQDSVFQDSAPSDFTPQQPSFNEPDSVYQEESSSSENREEAQEPTGDISCPALTVVNYISEFFYIDDSSLPDYVSLESIPIQNQRGKQTSITKIYCLLDPGQTAEDIWRVSLPVILREEYRTPESRITYPVSQDEPLEKDQPGTGALLLMQNDTEAAVLSRTASPYLELPAVEAGLSLILKADSDSVQSGQSMGYQLTVTNTGDTALSGIQLQSSFLDGITAAIWENDGNLQIQGTQAIIEKLEKKESKTFYLTASFTEEQSGNYEHIVQASVLRPGNLHHTIVEKAKAIIRVQPLKADFTVEKTADRTTASPGDTVTYQICIRNTGERTLHSVIGTERFLNAGVYAQFTEKPGVTLNNGKTQAVIQQIAPGEALALEAKVIVPPALTDRELINQVTVITRETGSRTLMAQSRVELNSNGITVTPTQYPYPTAGAYYPGGGSKIGGSKAYGVSSTPKTGDTQRPVLFGVLLLTSLFSTAIMIRKRKKIRKMQS